MQPGHLDEKLSLVMAAASNGLDDAVLNAPLPDMSLPGDPHVQHVPPTSAELQAAGHHLIHNEDPQHTLGLIQELNSHSHSHGHQEVSVGIITGEEHSMDLAGDTLDNNNNDNNSNSATGERPAKRRRGGRRVSNPNMTAEERRRQRVLKNRESAMRSLQKKAEYSANLAVEQKSVTAAHEAKKSHMFALVSTAAELREKLDSNNDIAVSIASCIERCNSLLQSSATPTSVSIRNTNNNTTTATVAANISATGNTNISTEDNNATPAISVPENHNINHNLNITNVPPAVPQAAIPLVPPIILPAGSSPHPPLPPH